MSRRLLFVAALPCLAACVTIPNLTAPEQAELAAAMASPLTFELSKDESAAAWGRAQVYVFKHSRIKIVSDFVIDAGRCHRYTAERLPLGEDRLRITIGGEPCGQTPAARDEQLQDAHVFAHFVRTGTLACARNGVSVCASEQESEFSLMPMPAVRVGGPSPGFGAPAPMIGR